MVQRKEKRFLMAPPAASSGEYLGRLKNQTLIDSQGLSYSLHNFLLKLSAYIYPR
jgi:hypothetical protein